MSDHRGAPPSAGEAPRGRRRAISASLGAAAVLGLVGLVGMGGTAAAITSAPRQSTDTTVDSRDENPLLVPGPDEPVGEAEDGAAAATPEDDTGEGTEELVGDPIGAVDGDGATDDDSAEATVRRVMYALVGVAVLLSALTAYYWWTTRPGPAVSRFPAPPGGRSRGRGGRAQSRRGDGGTVEPWQTDSTSTR